MRGKLPSGSSLKTAAGTSVSSSTRSMSMVASRFSEPKSAAMASLRLSGSDEAQSF